MGSHTCQEHLARRYFFFILLYFLSQSKSYQIRHAGHHGSLNQISLKFIQIYPHPLPTPQPDTLCVYFT